MTGREFCRLVSRVQTGILMYAPEEQIRHQLLKEGHEPRHIDNAIVQGRRLANVRLEKK